MDHVLVWAGEVDYALHDALAQQTAAAFGDDDLTRIVFDLSAVTFMDSIGIGLLLDARNQAHARNVGVALRAPTPSVNQIIEYAGLTGLFTIIET